MLDHSKIVHEIELMAPRLFYDDWPAIEQAMILFERMAHDESLASRVKTELSRPLPLWQNSLNAQIGINPIDQPYTIVAVDGSQIYPDRHEGFPCFLINIGLVSLRYGVDGKRVQFQTNPYLYAGDEDPLMSGSAIDFVNCQREAFEFADALTFVQQECASDNPLLLLFDGSLFFWHLESKDYALRKHFLQSYYSLLTNLCQSNILYASYVSLPRSKEIIQLMKFACGGQNGAPESLERLHDAQIMESLLSEGARSTFFVHQSKSNEQYPEAIMPHFCYCNVGPEIARIELPAWIANDTSATNKVMQIILDQAIKGRGYPVVLAEAHEQAVVKSADRDFFYHLIRRAGINKKYYQAISQKSLKKRTIGI